MPTISDIAAFLDAELCVASTPDYPPALNGVQVGHCGPVRKVAAAVDASLRSITMAAEAGANLLLVHHGLFWNGLRPVTGPAEQRMRALFEHDIAVYSAHLPLDAHETLGNSALLARELGLVRSAPFARYQHIHCGVRGESDEDTTGLVARVTEWARPHGHHCVASAIPAGHRTRRWAICSGSGAQVETLREAYETGVDTLIVGEGPHWSAVDAPERGLVIIYAGHYATETLGVRAVAALLEERFGLPWTFLHAPTGL
ncbi:MAG: Nif3-like dinuclear metal center hexameric protein [Gemmatimonadaceae bacterium]|nr:Nif3-like dinuclear metal center hexameric protein [Gemmatimonadaceae bacterium]